MKDIIILGTAGNALDILDTLHELNKKKKRRYRCLGFLDDNPVLHGRKLHGVSVLGSLDQAERFKDCLFVNGIGSSRNFAQKKAIIDQTRLDDDRFATLIHPSASVSRWSRIGFGTVVFQQVTITTQVTIGNHVIILPHAVISHDVTIDNYCCIAGGVCLSGHVHVGALSYLGSNCVVRERVVIGRQCLIGMGSVVLQPVADQLVVVGNPARTVQKSPEES